MPLVFEEVHAAPDKKKVNEEYFVLEMLGAKLIRQSIEGKGDPCDKMEVATEEGRAVHYFGIAKILQGRDRRP